MGDSSQVDAAAGAENHAHSASEQAAPNATSSPATGSAAWESVLFGLQAGAGNRAVTAMISGLRLRSEAASKPTSSIAIQRQSHQHPPAPAATALSGGIIRLLHHPPIVRGERADEIFDAIAAMPQDQRYHLWDNERAALHAALTEDQFLNARALIRWGQIPEGFADARVAVAAGDHPAFLALQGRWPDLTANDHIVGSIIAAWEDRFHREEFSPQTVPEILERHRRNVLKTQEAIAVAGVGGGPQGAAGAVITRNTLEFLQSGEFRLHVVTPTHDSNARATNLVGEANQVAYFGAEQVYPDASGTYDVSDVHSERNIYVAASRTLAETFPTTREIFLCDPISRSDEVVIEDLIHESQHALDHSGNEPGARARHRANTRRQADEEQVDAAWVQYKTEFRAHWVSGQFDRFNDRAPGSGPWANPRQRAVAQELTSFDDPRMPNREAAYPALHQHYVANTRLSNGSHFQEKVHAYLRPESVNIVNSVRIEAFYQALEHVSHNDAPTGGGVQALVVAAGAFNQDDRDAVNDYSRSWRLQHSVIRRCPDLAVIRIATTMNGGTLPSWVATVRALRLPPWTQ